MTDSAPVRTGAHGVEHERAAASEPLPRALGLWALWLLVVNGMIGAGIFGLPSDAARLAGDLSPAIFVLCAVLVLPILLTFGQLASRFGNTGGPMLYVATAFGPFAGFQAGWAYYMGRVTAFAANLSLMVATIGYFWPIAASGPTRAVLLLAICAGFAALNARGGATAIRGLSLLTVLKLLPLVLLVLAGVDLIVSDAAAPATGSAPTPAPRDGYGLAGLANLDLGAVILLVIYAYVGFESGLVPAGEARNPTRDMPRALITGLATVAVLYAAVQWVYVTVNPSADAGERPLVALGAALLGPTGAVVIVGAIIVSVGGNLLGSMFSTSRITYRLARDGQLPAVLGRVHPVSGMPIPSILLYAGIGCALALSGTFAWLAALSVVTRMLLYLACIAALPGVARTTASDETRRTWPKGGLNGALGAVVCLGLLTQVSLSTWLGAGALLGAGTLLYLWAVRAAR
ncbi:MAG: APC family permease [Gammaproteobacteria bacterium]